MRSINRWTHKNKQNEKDKGGSERKKKHLGEGIALVATMLAN
jgi:hypothetical protein